MLSLYDTILRSTKDATAMRKHIALHEQRDGVKLWICMADIVAMDPSIPLEDIGLGHRYDFRRWGLYSILCEVTTRAVGLGLITQEKRELIRRAITLMNDNSYLTRMGSRGAVGGDW